MLMTSLPYWPINTVDHDEHLVQLPARFRARVLGGAARRRSCGARASRSRWPPWRERAGSRPARRRRLRRQHRRRDLRLGRREPHPRLLVRLAARAAGADDRVGHVRAAVARAGGARLGAPGRQGAAVAGTGGARHRAGPGRVPHPDRAARFPASSSPTDATPRRGWGRRATSSTSAKGSARRWPSRASANVMNYHNAGKVQASSQPQDMRLQRMLGHFTTLVPKIAEESAGHRLRRRRDGRRGEHRSERRDARHRRNRAARPARRLRAFRRAQLSTSSAIRRRTWSSTMRGTIC